MFEKVNLKHPDKLADRIVGAIVDFAYQKELNPKIAVEVLIRHGTCHVICETSIYIKRGEVESAVKRIAGEVFVDYVEAHQDLHLSNNQVGKFRK